MEERETMTTEEVIEETAEETNGYSGIGTGFAMLIGSGLTLAAIAGGIKLKKVWENRKSKKEQTEIINEDSNDCVEYVDLNSEITVE